VTGGLVLVDTHPVQYRGPLYRALQQRCGIPITVLYGSDFSVAGYDDAEFGASFAWDTDLLSGYRSVYLSRVGAGGAARAEELSGRGLGATLRAERPAATLILGYSPRFHRAAAIASLRGGYPTIFRGETTDHAVRRSPVRSVLRDIALRSLYGRCARLLYVGQRSYQHFRRLGCSDEKLVFSPYSIDADAFECDEQARLRLRSSMRRTLGIPESATLLLFCGKLSSRKGPDLLLRALKALEPGTRARIVVMLVGSGELQDSLRALADAPPRVRVSFAGFQNQRGLSRSYHAADLLVLPSQHGETWGLVVNEALHHGLPCVASAAVGCSPDLIAPARTGEVFETGSVTGLAAALGRALVLVGRPQVRADCRRQANSYALERSADGIAQAYNAVIRTAHGAAGS
jgi:glycosyltransferase involved in cell wall biosynthesis